MRRTHDRRGGQLVLTAHSARWNGGLRRLRRPAVSPVVCSARHGAPCRCTVKRHTEVGGHGGGPYWRVRSDRRALHRVNDGCCTSVAPADDPVQHPFGLPGVLMRDQAARFFLCAGCRIQVLVCSHCDRGQRYCAGECASTTRRARQRDAGKRYQHGRNGRIKHASRTRSWRERQAEKAQSVTHQGSRLAPLDAVLAADPPTVPATAVTAPAEPCITIHAATISAPAAAIPITPDAWHCHWCCVRCVPHVRLGFLRHSLKPWP